MTKKKTVTVEMSEKDQKWVMAALRKKKAEERFFREAWKRREELKEDWAQREKVATEKARQNAEKDEKKQAEETAEKEEPKAAGSEKNDQGAAQAAP